MRRNPPPVRPGHAVLLLIASAGITLADPPPLTLGDEINVGSALTTSPFNQYQLCAATDPLNPARMVITAKNGTENHTLAFSTSNDGVSWTVTREGNSGDPTCVFDENGVVHWTVIDNDNARRTGYRRSSDGGQNWEAIRTIGSHAVDHPQLAVDTRPQSPWRGSLYVAGRSFSASALEVSRSRDGGDTWQSTYFSVGSQVGAGFVLCPPRVLANGTIVIYLASKNTILSDANGYYAGSLRNLYVVRSIDGGLTFSSPILITSNNGVANYGVGGTRCKSLAAGLWNGQERLYATYTQDRSGLPSVIMLCTSDDGGLTWSQPREILPVSPNGWGQSAPSVMIRPDGAVGIQYLNQSSSQLRARFTVSEDGGATFSAPIDVSTVAFPSPATTSQPREPGGDHIFGAVASDGSYRVVWTDNRQNNNTYTVYYRKVTLGGGGGGPPQADLVKDNKDATGIQLTGAWVSSTVTPGYYHSNYIHDNNTAKGTKSVRFTPTLSSAGNYEVFARWTSGENRASNVPMDIVHAGGTATVSVNQKINGQQWFSLGTYAFDAGANGSVLIRTAGTSGYVMADAVKFVPAVPEVIMDNGDPGIVVTGSWTVSTATVGYFGNNYLQDGNTGKGTKSVRYAPALFAADYEVFARWTAGSNRPANVPIDVVHLDGTDTVAVNQQANNGQWMSLGTYSFAAGTDGSVLVRTDGTSGSVIADAVKFSPPNGGGSAGGPLPSPWIQADVGTVGLAGEATYAAGTFSVQGTGTHLLSTTTDSFCYVYQAASGDCSITARIASHENNPTLGRYGVMIRESLAANATSAVLMMHSTGLSYKYRKSPGGSLGTVSGGAGSTPYWVRVARSGNTFTASKSTDGVNWASIGSATIVMGTDVHIGLVECSSNNAQPGTANFDNVTALP